MTTITHPPDAAAAKASASAGMISPSPTDHAAHRPDLRLQSVSANGLECGLEVGAEPGHSEWIDCELACHVHAFTPASRTPNVPPIDCIGIRAGLPGPHCPGDGIDAGCLIGSPDALSSFRPQHPEARESLAESFCRAAAPRVWRPRQTR